MNIQKIAKEICAASSDLILNEESVILLLKKEVKDELVALAVSWEETGKHSISNRIRETMNFCAKELKDFTNETATLRS